MFLRKLIMTTLLALSLGAPGQVPSMWRATVLAGESGEPLGGITFRDADGEVIATSATDGQVAFASQSGVRLELVGSARIASHVVLDGSPRDLGVLTLERSAVLLGRLLDPAGQPARGQSVWLASAHMDPPRYRDAEDAGHLYRLLATTGDDGSFRFEGLWTITGGSELLISEDGQVLRRFESIPRKTIDIGDVRLAVPTTVRGQVVNADGQPSAGARVALAPLQGWTSLEDDPERLLWRVTTADSKGEYRLDLAPGVYQAVAVGKGKGEIRGVEVRVGQLDAAAPLIRLGPTRTIGGRVVDESGRAVAGATVTAELPDPHALLGLRAAALTDEAGCWSIEDMPTHGVYLEIGGHRSPDFIVDAADLNSPPCAQAKAIVVDAAPTGRVRVVVDACRALSSRCEITHQTLDASRSRVSQGRWRVLGVPDGWDLAAGEWAIRAKATGYVTEEQTIVVVAGQEQEVRFDLVRQRDAVDMRVRVLGPAGRPASLAAVSLSAEDDHNDVYFEAVSTGADGIAAFSAVPAGRYSLSAIRFNYRESVRRRLDFPADDPSLELELAAKARSARLLGIVLNSEGLPVGGAAVVALQESSDSMVAATVSAFDGTFLMKVPARGYRIGAYATHSGLALPGDAIVLGEQEESARTLVLRQGIDLDGEFTTRGEPDQDVEINGPQEWPRSYLPVWMTRDGTYHVRGLPPGSWTFKPRHYLSDLDVEFVIEVHDDLTAVVPNPVFDFAPHFNVSGRVLLHGAPLAGVTVGASWQLGGGRTDADGRFALRGRRGTTELLVGLMAPFRHEIEPLEGDLEIEIIAHGARVAGEVVDKVSGAPIRTAEIFLLRDENVGSSHSYNDFLGVDGLGRFDFGTLPAGRWTLQIDAEGYTREVVELDVGDQPFDLLIEHEPTPGLRLHISDTKGDPVSVLGFAIQRPGEAARLSTRLAATGHDLWWPGAPTGPALLTVSSYNRSLFYRGEVENTGVPIDIVLRPGGWLEIYVPEELLPDESTPRWRSGEWQAQLVGVDEAVVPALDYSDMTTRFRLRYGDPMIDIEAIAPGEYELIVTGPEGFEWSTRVAIRAGERVRVQVPSR